MTKREREAARGAGRRPGAGEGLRKILVINSNEDTVEMLRIKLERSGFETLSAHVSDVKRGRVDLQAYLRRHQPAAIVYDIAPPYAQNWTFFKLLRSTDVMRSVPLVLTSTNKDEVEAIAGTPVLEVIGKPYDLDAITDAVHRALGGETGWQPEEN